MVVEADERGPDEIDDERHAESEFTVSYALGAEADEDIRTERGERPDEETHGPAGMMGQAIPADDEQTNEHHRHKDHG